MKYRKLGKNGPVVSALGLGAMGMSSEVYGASDRAAAKKVLQQAFDLGITFFDTADMYGKGNNEEILSEVLPAFREKIILATKCGLQRIEDSLIIRNEPAYIKQACQASLKRLKQETIDLYYLHRYNPEIPIEESMGTMQSLIQEGKIRYVGLSEVSPDILERAAKVLGEKLIALQSEFSLLNHKQSLEVLPTSRKLGLGFVAYSPIGRGLLSGAYQRAEEFSHSQAFDFRRTLPQFQGDALSQNLKLVNALRDFAKSKNCTPAQLSLAWLLAQGEDIIPIPGTKQSKYLVENAASIDIHLSNADLETIQQILHEYPVKGNRYPEQLFKTQAAEKTSPSP